MPLVVPALRLFMLFLNVYETFKTLKTPPASARRGGKPSVRAMTQRKRNLKGCLAIWIVWCCFAIYEKTIDGIIGLVTPFYEEMKSVLLLFLVLTRARGAEPLFLHVIRPMVKPYTMTLDTLLDLTCMFGDIFFALIQLPVELALPYWNSWKGMFWHTEMLESDDDSADNASASSGNVHAHKAIDASRSNSHLSIQSVSKLNPGLQSDGRLSENRRDPARSSSDDRSAAGRHQPSGDSRSGSIRRPSETGSVIALPLKIAGAKEAVGNHSRGSSQTNNGQPQSTHQVWYPPPSAYEDENENLENKRPSAILAGSKLGPVRPKTPPSIQPSLSGLQMEEWRSYPAFPAAYPLTPLPDLPPSLPFARNADQHVEPSAQSLPFRVPDTIHFPTIPADTIMANQVQGFGPSPQSPKHEDPSPSGHSSDTTSSSSGSKKPNADDVSMQLVDDADDAKKSEEESKSEGGDEGEDEDEDESDDGNEDEDDFDVTLRTPFRPIADKQEDGHEETMMSDDSNSSHPSRSTALTTADGASSLRSRTSSASINSLFSTSDLSSVAGQKRSFPRGLTDIVKKASAYDSSEFSDDARNATIRGRRVSAVPYRLPQLSGGTLDGDDEDSDSSVSANIGNGIHDIAAFVGAKRRRVASPGASRGHHRPAIHAREVRRPSVTSRHVPVIARGKPAVHTRIRSSSRATNTKVVPAPRPPSEHPRRGSGDPPAPNPRVLRERTVRGKA